MNMPPSPLHLRAAYQALRDGGILACPTEAVWGLSCDPDNPLAVSRLLQLKQRPVEKGLILVAASESQLGFLLRGLPQEQRRRLTESWPGPATWLIPHNNRVPSWVRGEHETVAVRVSAHPVVQALCETWGGPLVSTSANPGGAQPARSQYQVMRYFRHGIDGLVPGALGKRAQPTTIRDLVSGRVIRA